MRTVPSYQQARLESLRRSPWALIVVLAIAVAVMLLGQDGIGTPESTPGQPPVSAAPDPT